MRVSGSTASGNGDDGIEARDECRIIGNQCEGNGFDGDGAGIRTFDEHNHIEGNHVVGNDRGIDVDSSSSIIIKNTASNNTINYSIVAGNHVGQIIVNPGFGFSSSNSWANFAF